MARKKSRRHNPKAVVGFVNFPTNKTPSTGEGGVFVRLVVIDTAGDREYMNRYVPCCGGYTNLILDETFLGDDLLDAKLEKMGQGPVWVDTPRGRATYTRFAEKLNKVYVDTEVRYFPGLAGSHDGSLSDPSTYTSIPLLAVMTLGATGWSGQWRCQFKDLTRDGKSLYRSVEKLYPGCEVRLLTFLDT